MHAFQSLCYLLFAVSATAAPFNQTDIHGLAASDKILTCKNSGGNIRISQNKAEGNIHAAPLGDKVTKSGYPHEFGNREPKIVWPNKKCNADNVKLLEFPVFADGHLFPFDEKKPDDKSKIGPARGIYTYPSKDFCGVMAHTEKDNKGPFALCE
ncbi:putative a-sarcin precursor [Diplodia seriata]|uniref:Uncharacterized protein n=2 Tax=Diplodia TaxID=66735 RepID=A0ABR3TR60_9PEZI|nr:putative a-sarcin precursor [Diplodia seriata]